MGNAIYTSKQKENFLELTRAYSLLTSIAPWFIAVMASAVSPHIYSDTFIKLFNVFLTFVGVICVHLGGNLFDDFIDVKKKLKEGATLNTINFKNAKDKARLILDGTFSLNSVTRIIAILFAIALAIGIYFTVLYGWSIPLIMLITAILCLLYPLSSKCGFSELIIGIIFGPLLISGSFIAMTGFFSLRLLFLSIAVGLMTVVLLSAHSLMDFDYDKESGKKTLSVLAKTKTSALALVSLEIMLAYIIIIILAVFGDFSPFILLGVILTTPMAGKLVSSLKDYIQVKNVKFTPKWYLGPMENWEAIKAQKYDYFMYRFYIARNLGFLFCIILAFVCYFTLKVNHYYI